MGTLLARIVRTRVDDEEKHMKSWSMLQVDWRVLEHSHRLAQIEATHRTLVSFSVQPVSGK
jgi:hypothetical protein